MSPAPGSLVVVGTGIGFARITLEARAAIAAAEDVLYLVPDAVSDAALLELSPQARSLAGLYEEGVSRRVAYEHMVEAILTPVRAGRRVCAAFYGHPGVFVLPSHEAIRRARAEGFAAEMLPGVSAEDCLVADLGVDPAASGWQSYEATKFLERRPAVETGAALVLWQIGVVGSAEPHGGAAVAAARRAGRRAPRPLPRRARGGRVRSVELPRGRAARPAGPARSARGCGHPGVDAVRPAPRALTRAAAATFPFAS